MFFFDCGTTPLHSRQLQCMREGLRVGGSLSTAARDVPEFAYTGCSECRFEPKLLWFWSFGRVCQSDRKYHQILQKLTKVCWPIIGLLVFLYTGLCTIWYCISLHTTLRQKLTPKRHLQCLEAYDIKRLNIYHFSLTAGPPPFTPSSYSACEKASQWEAAYRLLWGMSQSSLTPDAVSDSLKQNCYGFSRLVESVRAIDRRRTKYCNLPDMNPRAPTINVGSALV